MTTEKIQFTHQAYVGWLKKIVILSGLDGAKTVGDILKNDCNYQHPAAFKTMEELGFEVFTDDVWQEAGELILSNEKIVIN